MLLARVQFFKVTSAMLSLRLAIFVTVPGPNKVRTVAFQGSAVEAGPDLSWSPDKSCTECPRECLFFLMDATLLFRTCLLACFKCMEPVEPLVFLLLDSVPLYSKSSSSSNRIALGISFESQQPMLRDFFRGDRDGWIDTFASIVTTTGTAVIGDGR